MTNSYEHGRNILWADLHNHSEVGYGKGTLERSYEIALAKANEVMDHFRFPDKQVLLEYISTDNTQMDTPAGIIRCNFKKVIIPRG